MRVDCPNCHARLELRLTDQKRTTVYWKSHHAKSAIAGTADYARTRCNRTVPTENIINDDEVPTCRRCRFLYTMENLQRRGQ